MFVGKVTQESLKDERKGVLLKTVSLSSIVPLVKSRFEFIREISQPRFFEEGLLFGFLKSSLVELFLNGLSETIKKLIFMQLIIIYYELIQVWVVLRLVIKVIKAIKVIKLVKINKINYLF